MGDSAKKQEALNALNGISYNDWMEIKFKIDKYFSLVIKESISNLKEESC